MLDVITIGTATRDIFLRTPAQLDLGAKIEVDEPTFAFGGGALNTSITFSRQGFKTATLIKIGDDETAKKILSELKKEKIISLAIQEKDKATAFSTILLSPSGERTVLVYRGASEDLRIEEIPFEKLETKWAYISPGNIPFEVIEKIFDYFSKNKTLIAFNPSKYYLEMGMDKLMSLLKKTKIAQLNREEGADLTGIDYENTSEIFKKLDEAITGIAIMTDASKGVMVSDGKNIYSAGIFSGQLIDRTGAGDAFGSGFVAGLMWGKGIEYAIRLGSANATSVVEKIGAAQGILRKEDFEKSKRWGKLATSIF